MILLVNNNLGRALAVSAIKRTMSLVFVATLLIGAAGVALPANAASAPKPKVGQCFNYTKADMDKVSPAKKASVKCTKTHNIEVYRVATFAYSGSPYTLSQSDLFSIATEACQPWTGND